MNDWTKKANDIYAVAKVDINILKNDLLKLRKITLDHDECVESENPFIALIDNAIGNLDAFMDSFESQ
jgi:hypothetical protein